MTSEPLYRILLKAYPSRYRREYEEAMAQCFRDQLRAANTIGKLLRLWALTISDFALSVVALHLEHGRRGDRFAVPLRGRYHGIPFGYTESAMQSIYWSRLEAASFSGREITLEHLLLATLRHEPELADSVLGPDGVEGIARAIEANQANPRRRVPPNECRRLNLLRKDRGTLPLGMDCKRVLAFAFWEAHGPGTSVSSRHVLSAIHQDTSPAGRLLRARAPLIPRA